MCQDALASKSPRVCRRDAAVRRMEDDISNQWGRTEICSTGSTSASAFAHSKKMNAKAVLNFLFLKTLLATFVVRRPLNLL